MSLDATTAVWARLEQGTGLLPRAKLVLLALADFTNRDTGLCCPSVKSLAKRTGQLESTVSLALVDLVRAELISVDQGGGRRSNSYVINRPHLPDESETSTVHTSLTSQGPPPRQDPRSPLTRQRRTLEPGIEPPRPPLFRSADKRCGDCDIELPDNRRLKARCARCQDAIDSQTEARKASVA